MTPRVSSKSLPRPTRAGRARRPYDAARERREQIVAATVAIIAERGLHGWKTAELAARVGLSEPALFRHFRDKQAILAAAVRQEAAALERLALAFEGAGDGWTRATGLVTAVLDFIKATGGGPLVILTGQLCGTSPATLKEVRETLDVVRRRLTALFAEAVEEARRTGAVPPEDLADLAIAILQSTALRWIMSNRTYPMQARAQAMLALARGVLTPVRRLR